MGTDAGPTPEDLPAAPSSVSPDIVHSYRWQLTPGEDVVDTATWAGAVPQRSGIAPRVRVGRSRWFNLLWLLPIGFVLLIIAVAVAKGLRGDPSMVRFIRQHPGTIEPRAGASTGFPAWLRWQHFFNLLLLVFIIRSGVQILSDHPRLYWTRHSTPGKDWFRIQRPVPSDPLWTAKQDSISLPGQVGLPGLRHSIGLARWWHLGVDALWLLNGVIFYVLLFATGQWQRLVPTTWDVFPNALSVLVQYLSLNEPLSFGHGAPLRLRNEIELGFKQVKWIKGIEFVAHYSEIGSGYGGYNQDHEFFGYRQSI
jgi:sulfoxide reductase catalytic subunit YedY